MSQNHDEVLVRVEGVSKKFCRSLKKSLWYGVCDIAGELLPVGKRRGTRDESYQANQLKIAAARLSALDARLLFPSMPPCSGSRKRKRSAGRRRVSVPQAGPEGFAGWGTVNQIDAKIDEIIDFAEIREFIDMPVQSDSSGMTVRLGFAVATALDPAFEIVKNRQHSRFPLVC